MPTPSARATTRHRQAEHTVVRTVSVTAATTACQGTARSPSVNGAAPTCRPRNHSTVTPAARRSNDGPKRRTAGPMPAGTEYKPATPVTRAGWTHRSTVLPRQHRGPTAGRGELALPRTRYSHEESPQMAGEGGGTVQVQPADESTVQVQPAADGTVHTIR